MRVIRGLLLGRFGHARNISGVYAGGVELTGAERAVAWVSLVLALGVLVVSVDMLLGGALFGWSPVPPVSAREAGEDD